MLYYSELLGKTFNSPEDCIEAEEKFRQATVAAEKKQKEANAQKEKIVKEMEAAEEAVNEAYRNYDEVIAQVKIILEESNQRMSDMLEPAKAAVKEAEAHRRKVLKEYQKQYGAPTFSYTNEFERLARLVEGASFSSLLKML